MPRRLPEHLDPLRRVEQGAVLRGWVALRRMERLARSLCDVQGRVDVELHFDRDAQRIPFVRGRVQARLTMICQRCLEPMEMRIERDLLLALVHSEAEAGRLPAKYEPLLVTPAPMDVAGIVEDELLLALPIVPLHAAGEPCRVRTPYRAGDDDGVAQVRHPFAVLGRLKRDH
ncbi:hypothetical protein BMS3Bbin12_00827 [bacterium BMS3Bbin12]|nr:hypothetical protein BMS3Abin12_00382 [bacterium BMS3Abin12]GBE47663.1 hypothetical protein BMS3Bbin12_00827 [bacterium BMS3Bbin12]GBE51266.1 hypothetical protein BMS3Bbin13_02224 [bacterium BMS3Bbin13]HDJ85683.1 hypothetical protein [Chromatiales bacterium]HDK03691.1 hypothetical protein [Gammaproteobacteria bacterium]